MDKGVSYFAVALATFIVIAFGFFLPPLGLDDSAIRTHEKQAWEQNQKLFLKMLEEWSLEEARANSHIVPSVIRACTGLITRYHAKESGETFTTQTPRTIIFLSIPQERPLTDIVTAQFEDGFPQDFRGLSEKISRNLSFSSPSSYDGNEGGHNTSDSHGVGVENGSLARLRETDAELGTRRYDELFEDASEICLHSDTDLEHFKLDSRDLRNEIEESASFFINIDAAPLAPDSRMHLYYHSDGGIHEAELPVSVNCPT